MNKICIAVCGPTASGKTAMSLQLARHFSTSILSFDSRQCFTELNIGVAKPTPDELQSVPHYFINTHHITDNVTAALFEEYGLDILERLFRNNDRIILVGGTGLYLKALIEGLDEIPPANEEIRQRVTGIFIDKGLSALQSSVKKSDPVFYMSADVNNPRRLMRALEVYLQTGLPYSTFINSNKKKREFKSILLAPDIQREELYKRIDLRVDTMIKDGLEKEAESLMTFENLPSLQTVGYREWFRYLN